MTTRVTTLWSRFLGRLVDQRPPWLDIGLAAGVVIGESVWLFAGQQPSTCSRFQYGASFAGEPHRFATWVAQDADGCRLVAGDAYRWLVVSALGALLSGVFAAAALYRWWPRSGSTWVRRARPLALLPLGVIALDLAQRVAVGLALAGGDASSLQLAPNAAWLAAAFAWPKAVGSGLTVALLVVVLAARVSFEWRRRRGVIRVRSDDERYPVDRPWDSPVGGLGICCSGGGIRAGSVALGVLGVLEADPPEALAEPGHQGRTILQRARYVSSVSGGGYTTGAWFNATGSPHWSKPNPGADPRGTPEPQPERPRVIGDTTSTSPPPQLFDEDPAVVAGQTLYRHVATRQQYLRTGAGGITRSVVVATLFLLANLAVIAVAVALVAWPAGRVARSWYVFGGTGCEVDGDLSTATCHGTVDGDTNATHPSGVSCANLAAPGETPPLGSTLSRTRCFLRRTGVQHDLIAAQVAPLVVFGGAGLALWAVSLGLRHTRRRRVLRTIGSVALATAAATALFAIVGPFLLDVVYPALRQGPAAVAAVIAGLTGITATVYRAVAKAITRRLVLVSGYLALGVLFLWAVYVAGNAAAREGALGLTNAGLLNSDLRVLRSDLTLYVAGLLIVGALFTRLEPRWWSLHALYRARLRDAFATTTNRDDQDEWVRRASRRLPAPRQHEEAAGADARVSRVWPLRRNGERPLDDFSVAPAPAAPDQPVGPVHLICCTAARRPRTGTGIKGESFVASPYSMTLYETDEEGKVYQRTVATDDYMAVLPRRERTESMWLALSGAAVAPAMGRMTRGTLGTLFAIMNLRLGVWMPNPVAVPSPAGDKPRRYPRAGVIGLAKEVLGAWSVEDDHLYVTDGGHWDNLGLVELLRRRCRTIICVDASGDSPGSFATLRQAAQLAVLQVGARVVDVPAPVPAGAPMADSAYMMLHVDYLAEDGATMASGEIVYLPARIWSRADRDLQAFAAEDPVFPSYSTGNQLLSHRQFVHLVQLGRCMAEQALGAPEVQVAVMAAVGGTVTGRVEG